jgi:hypothetical protein
MTIDPLIYCDFFSNSALRHTVPLAYQQSWIKLRVPGRTRPSPLSSQSAMWVSSSSVPVTGLWIHDQ